MSFGVLAGVWQEHIQGASVNLRMVAGVWQERLKESLGMLAGV